jgi:hypothetical protein
MATTSEVKAGLDDISRSIRDSRQAYVRAKASIEAARNQLSSIPTTFSDVIATIDAYTGADAFEQLAADEKARLASEFTALRDEMDALINSTEF